MKTNMVILLFSFLFSWQAWANTAPVVDAGEDFSMEEGTSANLNATVTDVDGDSLFHEWTQIAGTPITIINPSQLDSQILAPATVPLGGITVTYELFVFDGTEIVTDTVNITITNANNIPVAQSGADQTVSEGALVTLDGSGSFDADNDNLTYLWEQLSGSSVILSDASAVQPQFTAPSYGSEVLEFSLTVSDGIASTSDNVLITIEAQNQIPLANAGENQTVIENTFVTLDGSASSDPDGDDENLTYAWTQLSGTSVSLSDATAQSPSFTAPQGPEDLEFQLIVNDGQDNSEAATIKVSVNTEASVPNCDLARAKVKGFKFRRRHSKTSDGMAKMWPPNHRMKKVVIRGLFDDKQERRSTSVVVDSITQDEATTGTGRGDTGPDAQAIEREVTRDQITVTKTRIFLRSERDRHEDGRVYEINFTATNEISGLSCQGSVKVCVPHKKKKDCTDNGQTIDSFN